MTLPALASALLLLVTLGYIGLCAGQPFARCRKCSGLGFALATDRKGRPKRGKTCRRCHGHGIRIRRGRHLYNLWRRTYDRGTR
jgi:ribosomal protein L40E